jgi:type I restriction enzyme R subunit
MREIIRRRHLPHWDVPSASYFVTFCLEGSMPAHGLRDLLAYQAELEKRPMPLQFNASDWFTYRAKLAFVRAEHYLDNHSPVRHFADQQLASVVEDALFFFAGQRTM